jgi:hypothetical protein
MAPQIKHFMDEPDIGSGEKNPAQEDVEREQNSIHPKADTQSSNGAQETQNMNGKQAEQPTGNSERTARESGTEGRLLKSGTHLARILALAQPDGTYEAQVYVRLTREPEVAETYIPAGTFTTEEEAWAAAEERASRAFKEHEF